MLNPINTFFSDVEDPRTGLNVRYPMNEILLVAVVTLLCGGESFGDMADVGRAKRSFLEKFFRFEKGIPSEDTFRYVLMLMDPRKFGDCFAHWMRFLHGRVKGLVAIDGKACRGTARDGKPSALTMVNAFCVERGVVLAGLDTPDKTNEITVLPELLAMLDLKGCIVTLDAMGCQRAVVAQIVEQKGDYLISLKGNQGNLHQDVATFFQAHEQTDPDFKEAGFKADVHEYEEKNRGRHYRRKIVVTDDFCGGLEPYKKDWKGLRTVVRLESWRTEKGKTTHEIRHAISSCQPRAKEIAKAARGHWAVENQNHWMLDVCFREDPCQVRAGHAAKNLAILRRLCLNIVRHTQKHLAVSRSVKRWMRWCAMDDESLKDVLDYGLNLHFKSRDSR